MFFRPRIRVEFTLWGDDYVAGLPESSTWFTRHRFIPRIGDTIRLPRRISAARSVPPDAEGWSTETVEIHLDDLVGTVTHVLYVENSNSVTVGVWPQSRVTAAIATGKITSHIPGI